VPEFKNAAGSDEISSRYQTEESQQLLFCACEQLVLVTGVGGSSNQWQTQQNAYLARKAGIHVVAVGAGRWLDRYELGNVVSQPRTANAIFAYSFSTLQRDATASVHNIICNSQASLQC